jgi:uncharacterized DUF497 family protein
MRVTWDPEKRESNLEKHGLDFVDAARVFAGVVWTFEDRRKEYGERRYIGYGFLEDLVVTIAFTDHMGQTLRIISMRKASRYEQREFFKHIPY